MEVWSFIPQNVFTEFLEWKTDLIRAKGAEQRIALRNAPRIGLEYSYIWTPKQLAKAKMFAKAFSQEEILIPLWGELTNLSATSSGGDTLDFDTRFARYAIGDQCIIWGDEDSYEILTIDTLTDSQIGFSPSLANSYDYPLVVPIKVGYFEAPLQISRRSAPSSEARAAFVTTDSEELATAGGGEETDDAITALAVTNGDFSTGNTTGWTKGIGTWDVTTYGTDPHGYIPPSPSGGYHAVPVDATVCDISQNVSLTTTGVTTDVLDTGAATLRVRWEQGVTNGDHSSDSGYVKLVFKNSGGTTLSTVQTNNYMPPYNDSGNIWIWEELYAEFNIPTGARSVDTYFMAVFINGTNNNSSWDNLRLDVLESGSLIYRGYDAALECRLATSATETHTREVDTFDSETGLIWEDSAYLYPVSASSMVWQPTSKEALWNIRTFLHERKGRQKGFWIPSWNNDFSLAAAIGSTDTTITINEIGYTDHADPKPDNLVIITKTDTLMFEIVGSSNGSPGYEVIGLDHAIGIDIALSEVKMVCFLTFMRLAADRIELRYIPSQSAEISVGTFEVPSDLSGTNGKIVATPEGDPLTPDSYITPTNATKLTNSTITFTAVTNKAVSSYSWTFVGGAPSSGTTQSVDVTYSSDATYNITLEVTFTDATTSNASTTVVISATATTDGIQANGTYWEWNGAPKVFIGGTNGGEPHLYEQQYSANGITINDATDFLGTELTKIVNAGGNYFRCTLASWQPPYVTGGLVLSYPFSGYPDSFNLTTINQNYFDRIDALAYRCEALGIVPQFEVFDTWWSIQSATVWEGDGTVSPHYAAHEFNPAHVTSPADYTTGNTRLTEGSQDNNDLFTAPALANETSNPLLIAQKIYVSALCDVFKKHKNILIQIQNESIELPAWADFWVSFIRSQGVTAPITNMDNDFDNGTEANWAMTHSQYGFGDSSQQNWGTTDIDALFNDLITFHSKGAKPVNAVKIYENPKGNIGISIDKMFMSLMAGNAACAFHPGDGTSTYSGIGVITEALEAMEAARWLDNNCSLQSMAYVSLSAGQWGSKPSNGAWACQSSTYIAIYVNSGTSFTFNTTGLGDTISMRWKDVTDNSLSGSGTVSTSSSTSIANPFSGNRAILIMTRA